MPATTITPLRTRSTAERQATRGRRRRAGVATTGAVTPVANSAAVLQLSDGANPGSVLRVLSSQNVVPRVVRIDLGEPLPAPGEYRFAVVVGAQPGAPDPSRPWQDTVQRWLIESEASGTSAFAVGRGGQLSVLRDGAQPASDALLSALLAA